jgi:hypothetical protein
LVGRIQDGSQGWEEGKGKREENVSYCFSLLYATLSILRYSLYSLYSTLLYSTLRYSLYTLYSLSLHSLYTLSTLSTHYSPTYPQWISCLQQ